LLHLLRDVKEHDAWRGRLYTQALTHAPPGVSDIADECRGLVKAGVLRGISAGIDPIEVVPLDPKQPYGAMRLVRGELLEISLVPVPASATALVTARSFAARPSATAMLRSLPALSAAAIERALAHVGRSRAQQVPIMSLSVYARTALYAAAHQQRCRATWACGQARQAEARAYSYQQRQEDLRNLSRNAPESERRVPRRRLRPYGL
jgi:hypothetical protein